MTNRKAELVGLIELIAQNKEFLKKSFTVTQIAIFGSYAKVKQKKTSDIDILVKIDSDLTIFDFLRLENHLSALLNKKVDLGTFESTKEIVNNEIQNDIIYV
jgi:predicted nucleotidyltransferase